MENIPVSEVFKLVQSGGNVALLACVYFIYRAGVQLARIEKALDELVALVRQNHNGGVAR